jgi:hypothetical protein
VERVEWEEPGEREQLVVWEVWEPRKVVEAALEGRASLLLLPWWGPMMKMSTTKSHCAMRIRKDRP